MATKLWLRAETKSFEERTPLTPSDAKRLVDKGVFICVEKSHQRIFSNEEYLSAGCELTEAGSWPTAPLESYILGLKELPEEDSPLIHHHIFFAHAYKGQTEAKPLLERFREGGGEILDLEYLIDENGRRVCAFGRWAGFVGAALSVDYYYHLQKGPEAYPPLKSFESKEELLNVIRSKKENSQHHPQVIVIGAKGRCGQGALQVAQSLNLNATEWDYEETKGGGPFKEITEHEIFVNTVLLSKKVPPFIDKSVLREDQKLRVIGDVSCDPNNPNNPIPLYDQVSTWEEPFIPALESPKELSILAVDNLPSVLPKESSEDFSAQLTPHLINLFDGQDPVWNRSREFFRKTMENL